MKTIYRYIKFEKEPDEYQRWWCINKKSGTELAGITLYEPWNQWVAEFNPGCVFNSICLNDISDFLTQLNQATKKSNRKKVAKQPEQGS